MNSGRDLKKTIKPGQEIKQDEEKRELVSGLTSILLKRGVEKLILQSVVLHYFLKV